MVFDDDINRRNEINCHYLMALGYYGLGNYAQGYKEFRQVLQLDPAHLPAEIHSTASSWSTALQPQR